MIALHDALDRMASNVPVEDRLSELVSTRPVLRTGAERVGRPRRLTVVVAAVCAALVAAAGLVLLLREPDSTQIGSASPPRVTAVAPGIPEPLFVLPGEPTASAHDGQVAVGTIGPADGTISLIARRAGATYTDFLAIAVLDHPVELGAGANTIMLANGEASVLQSPGGSVTIVQQRGDQWLRGIGYTRSGVIRALEQATIDDHSALAFGPGELEILTTEPTNVRRLVTSLFFTDDGVTVETANEVSLLLTNIGHVRDASRVTVRGHAGWRVTMPGPEGSSDITMLTWMETPAQKVDVFGNVPIERILALAEGLVVVDYPTWHQAVHDLITTDTPTVNTG